MSEALRLANDLDRGWAYKTECAQAAAELRRLAAVEAQRDELLESLKKLARIVDENRERIGFAKGSQYHRDLVNARAAIAKAE